jgi:hypothetical protein
MKYLQLILIVITIGLFSCNLGPTPEKAVQFNDSLVFAQDTLYQSIDLLIDLIEQEETPEEIRKAHAQALMTAEKYYTWMTKRPAFDESDMFRLQAIQFFQTHIHLLNNEFATLIAIIEKPHEEIVMQDQHEWDSLLNIIIVKDSIATQEFLKHQAEFAEKYNFSLQELD